MRSSFASFASPNPVMSMHRHGLWRTWRCFWLGVLLGLAQAVSVQAGTQHTHLVVLAKESSTALRFDFQINPVLCLHQLTAPQVAFPDFLKTHAALSEADFRKVLARASRKLEAENFVQLPSGEKLALLKWQLPTVSHWQDLIRKNLMILDLPPQFQAHLEPVGISAWLKSSKPLHRVQLTLSPVFHPILFQYQQDLVWFTPLIPSSLIDL
jgi:hypothetical protein